MIRPAGESSDEDEYKDYISDDEVLSSRNATEERVLTKAELRQQIKNSLFMAILSGQTDIVISILDDGFNVNNIIKDNWTPLTLASSMGNPEIVGELLKRHADVNLHKDFYTPLMAISSCPFYTSPYEKSLEVAKQLISNNADVNAKSHKRITALMYAAGNGNVGIVSTLLPICDKHARDHQGWTALFWAVNGNKPEVLKVLLEAELEFEKSDIRGNTPLHYAKTHDFEEILNLLPCKQKEDRLHGFLMAVYNVHELFESERPKFLRDVTIMLYGMKCDQYAEHMIDSGIDLLKFLTLTDADLLNLGIIELYQRYSILSGLHKFHKRHYKIKSMPVVPKDGPLNSYNVFSVMTAICRQLIVMKASLKYLVQNVSDLEQLKGFQKEIKQIKWKLKEVKQIAKAVKVRINQWDIERQPADLITSCSYQKLRKRTFRKYATIGFLSVVAFITVRKLYRQ